MSEGIGDDMDGLLNFMDEEKVLDPFLSWLGWFTNLVIDKEEGKSEEDSEESKSIIAERNDVIKQALIPTLVNIIRHARMQEHGNKPIPYVGHDCFDILSGFGPR